MARRPALGSVRDGDQPDRHLQLVAGASHSPLEHRLNPKPFGDLLRLERAALEYEARSVRGDAQGSQRRERVRDPFGQAVGEVVLVRLHTEVGEGQPRDRRGGHRRSVESAGGQATP